MDATGKIADRFTIKHSAEAIAMLIRRLAKHADPADVQIGIERPNGRLVDLLLEAGHPVVPVSPNAIKTWRDGEVLSGAKSDTGDAAVIAEYLRQRQHRLRVAVPYCDDARKSGKDHPHAIRVLARAWIRVIWRCWHDGVLYDPAKHGAAAALNEPVAA
ncbi:hypothetical protein Misp02_23710 [Microtetraspora sp. NBRC 16547]|nr:hypothetical protein Misp02_23710 [Microtetraspora sp. NBRC 16547]